MRILDAGCGGGRNLVYLLSNGFEVAAADRDPASVEAVRAMASRLAPNLPGSNFRVEAVEDLSFPDACADVVISSAVLHFASNPEQFEAMLTSMWRVPEARATAWRRRSDRRPRAPCRNGRYHLPDGSERYLVDEETLTALTDELAGELLDPLKTTVVQDRRCMTTWVVRRAD
jgi:SAM-dependent methyltransferase